MNYQTLNLTQDGPVATVSLNRPEVHNAFNAKMIVELSDAFAHLANDDTIRVIVLRGNGPSFCAGADVEWMQASLNYTTDENIADALRMSDMFKAIDTVPHAVVGRIHGATLGGGMGLLAVCDLVIAAANTTFGFTEARLGIIPAVISRYVVPKIGPSWARALFLTAERFGPERAHEIGLVHEVVLPEELDAVVQNHIEAILSCGPRAVREAKALIAGLAMIPPSQWREYTAQKIATIRTTPEGQEGLRAFLEKRPPAWRTSSSVPREG
jgi:methylglutaconyl-CoA hydratase